MRFQRNKSIRQKTQESIKIITKTKMKKLKCLRRPRNNFNKMMTIPIVKLRKPKIKNSRKILIAMRQTKKFICLPNEKIFDKDETNDESESEEKDEEEAPSKI